MIRASKQLKDLRQHRAIGKQAEQYLPMPGKRHDNVVIVVTVTSRIRPTSPAYQPDTGSPVRTTYSILPSVFATLDIVFFYMRKAL